jgi:hypothetical protein
MALTTAEQKQRAEDNIIIEEAETVTREETETVTREV